MKTTIVFGPPGTGKTTYLLQQLEHALNSYSPHEIAFVSFTRASVREGIQRAKERFSLTDAQVKYFKTIHALCFFALGMHKTEVIQKKDYKIFSDAMNMRFVGYYSSEFKNADDQYIFVEQLFRNNKDEGLKFAQNLDARKLAYVVKNYQRYKAHKQVYDYTDMLQQYLRRGEPLPIKFAIIDEAQDLTPLQWDVVDKMFSGADVRIIAGDDDQAIYQWAGSDVRRLLTVPGERKILDKSYRLPLSVFNFATKISAQIQQRVDKVFRPRGEKGSVSFASKLAQIDICPADDTLILSRNNVHLAKVEEYLQNEGIPYTRKGVPAVNPDALQGVETYEKWRKKPEDSTPIGSFRDYFVAWNAGSPWHVAANREKIPVDFLKKILDKNVHKEIILSPKIKLETIHGSKGMEAENVILLLDVTKRVYQNMIKNMDGELRTYYVGCTRAKKKLTLKYGEGKFAYTVYE